MTTIAPTAGRRIRWRFVFALSASSVLHVGLLLVARETMRARLSFAVPANKPMQLRLIVVDLLPGNGAPEPNPPRSDPAPAPAPAPALKQRLRIEKQRTPTAVARSTPVSKADATGTPPARVQHPVEQESSNSNRQQQPRLVAMDGRVYIPDVDGAIAAATARFPVKPAPPAAGTSLPFSHRSPLPYVSTRFDPLWVPDGENLLGSFLRKLSDKVVKKGGGQVAGIQIDCVWIVVVAGCTWGSPPRISIDELKKLRADVPLPRGPNTQPGS